MNDTIAAISTALGIGAIAIIRVSGKNSIPIVNKIFKGSDLTKKESHTITYGHIIDDNKIIDEVLVTIMKSPKTFTTEDTVEINCHGGISSTNKILELLLSNDCRLAEPGEFTKRAYLNGRIDLLEAESVMDIINSKTEKSLNLAMNQLEGKISKMIRDLKSKELKILSNIEVNIDYPEYDDIEVLTNDKIKPMILELKKEMNLILKESESGKIINEGVNVTIIGKPNVGKSSLLNLLIEEEKAIVTDIAGTTRDIVEGNIIINGVVFKFIDTAGIRDTENVVERIGVEKSLSYLDKADLVLLVLNNNEILTPEEKELIEKIKNKNYIIIVNKIDLENKIKIKEEKNIIRISTYDKKSRDIIKNKIREIYNLDKIELKDANCLSNARSISLMKEAVKSLDNALNAINNNIPIDMVELDIKESLENLSKILGEKYSEDLINEMFSNFCLGK